MQRKCSDVVILDSASSNAGESSDAVGPALATSLRSFHGRLLKRGVDVCLSLPIVIFVLPPVAAISWVAQRLQSRGPLLFKQERCGIGRKKFTILKIRTMDQVDHATNENAEARIFPLGNLLRKTKLDEIPQFVNVLAGAMSVVGPRPHHFEDCENFEKAFKDYAIRTIAKPGITGLAQYKEYRGDFEWNCTENRVQRDLAYIQEWSLLLDVKLIFKTANVIFQKSRNGLVSRLGHRIQKPPVSLAIFKENEEPTAAEVDVVPLADQRKAA